MQRIKRSPDKRSYRISAIVGFVHIAGGLAAYRIPVAMTAAIVFGLLYLARSSYLLGKYEKFATARKEYKKARDRLVRRLNSLKKSA